MIDVLISGRLRGTPSFRTANSGATYSIFKLAAQDHNGASLLCSCVSFAPAVQNAIRAMESGDSVAVSGEATPNTWQDTSGKQQQGLDVRVHGVLTAYHLGRKRAAA